MGSLFTLLLLLVLLECFIVRFFDETTMEKDHKVEERKEETRKEGKKKEEKRKEKKEEEEREERNLELNKRRAETEGIRGGRRPRPSWTVPPSWSLDVIVPVSINNNSDASNCSSIPPTAFIVFIH